MGYTGRLKSAPVAQLDRVPVSEAVGRRFESYRARCESEASRAITSWAGRVQYAFDPKCTQGAPHALWSVFRFATGCDYSESRMQ